MMRLYGNTMRRGCVERVGSLAGAVATVAVLVGCASTGNSSAPASSGAAGGSTAVGGDANLQTCSAPVGTVRLQDGNEPAASPQPGQPTNEVAANIVAVLNAMPSWATNRPQNSPAPSGGASIDSMRLLIQQSNCFVIVDRGGSEISADDEKRRARTGNEMRANANLGAGQEVAADYVLRATVVSLGTSGSRGISLGALTRFMGQASVGQSVTEAKVQLVLSDIRSKVQVSAAQGEGSGSNTSLASNVLGRVGGGFGGVGLKSETKTSSTTVLLQALADAYNKMVPAVQNYKPQMVQGGLGGGGLLGVQGAKKAP